MQGTILLVEDEAAIAAFVQTALEREGVAVEVVEDGQQALARVNQALPDLIILDLMLPGGVDGLAVAEQARAFAEPILAAIADRPPDYEDDFSDPTSGWGVGGQAFSPDVEGETRYIDGEYFIIAAPGACIGSVPPTRRPLSDFVLEVEGRFVSGQTGDWALHFRTWRYDLTNEDGKYAVVVHSDGHIDVFRFE